jgi:hypothetical protein
MCLPACRIIQTGIRSTDSPRAARNSRGSRELDDAAVANADAEKTNNDNAIGAYISISLRLRIESIGQMFLEKRRYALLDAICGVILPKFLGPL